MSWQIVYFREALEDLKNLDGSQRKQILKTVEKVRQNPLPNTEGGYGKPLGNKLGIALSGLMKIKLPSAGLRVVYRVERKAEIMQIIIISVRSDEKVYLLAEKRMKGKK